MSPKQLPYIWAREGAEDLAQVLRNRGDDVIALLLEHGAVLFKGFGIDSIEKFQQSARILPGNAVNYIDGNSPRTKLASNIYTSTEYPPELPISLHNELSYSHAWPERLYFCCIEAPATGGSTLIADSRAILSNLPAGLVDDFVGKGVMYVRNLHGGSGATMGKSWQQTFETESRAAVEQLCKDGAIEYEWKRDGGIRLIQRRPATATHPRTGARVWFNQVDQFHPSTNPPEVYEALMEIFGDDPLEMPQYGCFGDGTPIPVAALDEVRAVAARQTVAFPWERGDVMVIDNMLTAHGRAPFTGSRRILVTMSG